VWKPGVETGSNGQCVVGDAVGTVGVAVVSRCPETVRYGPRLYPGFYREMQVVVGLLSWDQWVLQLGG
jgi:hypothetical protein